MNNKQKQEYIDCLTLLDQNCFLNEIQYRNSVLSKCPNTLFKYRSFDEYTKEMITEDYAYLTPVEELDDPFDCITDFGLKYLYDEKSGKVKKKFLNYIEKRVPQNHSYDNISSINEILANHFNGEAFSPMDFKKIIDENKVKESEKNRLFNILENCSNLFDAYEENGDFRRIAEVTRNPGKQIGVLSLSELRDNKVMWSLYGDTYEGYCIEYELPYNKKTRGALFPVIYSSKSLENNFAKCMFDTMFGVVMRYAYSGHFSRSPHISDVGAIYKLFCIKDKDWSYQKEWRILGKPKDHFKHLNIKAIYLGFNVNDENEKIMIELAKDHFDLYKMLPPTGKKKIKYKQIVYGHIKKSN